VIRVTINTAYAGNFVMSFGDLPTVGTLNYFGAGKIDMENKIYDRSTVSDPSLPSNLYLDWK